MDKSTLRSLPLFESLEEEELDALAELLVSRKYQKGAYVISEGDDSSQLYLILKGAVRATLISEDGKEFIIAHLPEKEFFGELSLLTEEGRSANVVAVNSCEMLVLSKDDFFAHTKKHTGLLLSLAKQLALRTRKATSKMGDLALLDVYRRVAKTLYDMGIQGEHDGERCRIVEKRPTHKDLAAMAGTSREMVTRALKGLEEEGCIEADGKDRLIIFDLPL